MAAGSFRPRVIRERARHMSPNDHADSVQGAVQAGSPGLLIGNQYVRSLSLTVPGAPGVYANVPLRVHMALGIDVSARQLADNQPNFEVTLVMRAQGLRDAPSAEVPNPERLYEAELAYSGLVMLQNAGPDTFEPLLLIEAPRMLFPGARNVLAMNVREAGFPVTMLQPVDFVALWHARRAQR